MLYMKLIWYNGFPRDLCLIGGGSRGQSGHRYMCIVIYIYMKLILCNGFPEIYACLEEGVGSICHGYMCIVTIYETYLV